MYKVACTRAVNQPRMLKRHQMNALKMCYDPKVWYKNNLIFNFMNLMKTQEILESENMREKNELTYKMTCISVFKRHMVLKMT